MTLNRAYEGEFDLKTSARVFGEDPVVHHNDGAEDPTGLNRKRNLRIEKRTKGRVVGEVFWGDGTTERDGMVRVGTSNSPVVLELA